MEEVLKWVCPKCEKEIKSLYKNQFEYNKKQHEESCNKEKD